jgi:hypothetical protein
MRVRLLGVAALLGLLATPAHAGHLVDVTYTLTGSPGNWLYDFTVTNNLRSSDIPAYGDIVAFGVQVGSNFGPGRIYVGTGGWDITGGSVQPTRYSPTYNYGWQTTVDEVPLLPGHTITGFEILDRDAAPKIRVPWYAYTFTYDPLYTHVYIQGVSGIPELSTWAMMLFGFAGLGFVFCQSRRKVSFA